LGWAGHGLRGVCHLSATNNDNPSASGMDIMPHFVAGADADNLNVDYLSVVVEINLFIRILYFTAIDDGPLMAVLKTEWLCLWIS
jgi:hypothetical protein